MKRILQILLSLYFFMNYSQLVAQSNLKSTMAWGDQTYWKDNASSGNWNANNWYNATQGWDNHNPNYEGGRNLIFDNNSNTTMTNDFAEDPGFKRWQISFTSNATSSRTISGSVENVFYDNSGTKPKIENLSTVNHSIGFPIKIGYNPLELNPINGDLTISSSINNDGKYIDIYGPNNKVLTLSGTIIGSGGISLKQNSKLVLSTTAKTYTGATVLEAGTLDLSISLSSNKITVKNGAKLYITGTNVTINDLTIETGGVVEVQAGKALTVSGTITNNAGAGGLVVKSGGSLKQNSAVLATVERDVTNADWANWKDGWHFLSSPVSAQAIDPNFTTAPYDFYTWREASNEWVNYKNTTTSPTWNEVNGSNNFIVGKGYMAAYDIDNNNTILFATKTFSGTLNKDNVPVNGLSITGSTQANRSWHLLGNPFSCALTWDASAEWALLNIAGVAQIWNESIRDYTLLPSVPTASVIPATNGFMVQASGGTGSLIIPLAKRDHSSHSYYKSSVNEIPQIKLYCSTADKQSAKESSIMLYPDATEGYDLMYDGEFLHGFGPSFYSQQGDLKLSLNALAELPIESVTHFGFIKNDASEFTIELKQSIEGLPVYLTDLKTNTDQNLSENPVYTFTSEAGDDPNRFELRFMTPTGLDKASTQSTIRVYSTNGKINISGVEGKAEVFVRNIMGQVFLRNSVNGSTLQSLNTSNLPAGVYMVSVVSATKTVSQKVVVK